MYKVTVPLIQVATKDGVAVQVTKGGPVPSNITPEALANLIDLGYVVEEEGGSPSKSEDSTGSFDVDQGGNIKDTLAWVGDDKDRAQQALDVETAKGDAARGSLVESLEKITSAE